MRLISAQEEAGIWWWLTFVVFESFTWYGEQGLICMYFNDEVVLFEWGTGSSLMGGIHICWDNRAHI
jgi:hypothetical protein